MYGLTKERGEVVRQDMKCSQPKFLGFILIDVSKS